MSSLPTEHPHLRTRGLCSLASLVLVASLVTSCADNDAGGGGSLDYIVDAADVDDTAVADDDADTTPDDIDAPDVSDANDSTTDSDGDGDVSTDDAGDPDTTTDGDTPDVPDPTPIVAFTDVSEAAGLTAVQWTVPASFIALKCPMLETFAGGAAVGDVDGDGDDDIVLPRWDLPDLLLLNDGAGVFEEADASWGLRDDGPGNGAVLGDLDADGDLDLIITHGRSITARVYRNDGDTFVEVTDASGGLFPVDERTECTAMGSPSLADVDGDGLLDLAIAQWDTRMTFGGETMLLHNRGDFVFEDRTVDAGIIIEDVAAFTPQWTDLGGDGDADLLLVADFGETAVFEQTEPWTFSALDPATHGFGTEENGMGGALGDINGDGHIDWFITSIFRSTCTTSWGCSGNRFYLGDGDGGFEDISEDAGVRDGGWGWGAALVDLDLDGDLDIVHAAGIAAPWSQAGVEGELREIDAHANDPLRLWLQENGTWTNAANALRITTIQNSRAIVPFDADTDGDLDVLITRNGDTPVLLRNDLTGGGDWLRVEAFGDNGQPAVGAVVRVDVGTDHSIRADITANSSYLATGPPVAHIGLGAAPARGVRVEVRSPWNGRCVNVADASVNTTLRVDLTGANDECSR